MADNDTTRQEAGTTSATEPQSDRQGQLTQITRAMVAIYKEQFGRGPRFAHSHFCGPDGLVCYLEETLTPVEQSLGNLGEHQQLRNIRMLFQYTAEDAFCGAIESITGRRVAAFSRGIDQGRRRYRNVPPGARAQTLSNRLESPGHCEEARYALDVTKLSYGTQSSALVRHGSKAPPSLAAEDLADWLDKIVGLLTTALLQGDARSHVRIARLSRHSLGLCKGLLLDPRPRNRPDGRA